MNHESALNFVAGAPRSGAHDIPAADSDLTSWLVMSGDLLGSSSRGMFDLDDSFMMEDFGSPVPTQAMHLPPSQQQRTFASMDGLALPQPACAPPPPQVVESNATPTGTTTRPRRSTRASSAVKVESRGTKRKANGEGKSEHDPDSKRERRLARNREIAKACRKRKREKFSKLEEEVARLQQENEQLQKQVNKGRDGRDREVARKSELMGMKKLLETKCSDAEMKAPLSQYKEIYSDFGKERKLAIQFHMRQLKSLLIPNTVSKMTLWSLQQDDEFYDEKKNEKTFGGGIWNMLCSELQFTDEQKKTLLGMRHGIRTQRKNIAECLRILKELEGRVDGNFESMQKQMEMVMSTITPTQQAKFLLWIERNKACTFMINSLWQANEKPGAQVPPQDDDDFDDSASTMGMSEVSSKSSCSREKYSGSTAASIASSAESSESK